MKKYEYMYFDVGYDSSFMDMLNKYGKEGWRYVEGKFNPDLRVALLEREIE